ncbi:DUF58 domain-containing protein [Allobranchiibius huperziae]|uniref:Uncharacterized protein (DUF58 family) n=1 Tax=Allobranchiibius huperziae TaxID=1874116 RepID=A0A853DHQ2_9MICO|nr:DUF58 domain-containing protein [Allobranchiibius huperziae]NYJ75479.1 uncharacterized protein (DUF58 family) [Allobranchiibius huperziae]
MAITGRAVLLAALGLIYVAVVPRASSVLVWLAVVAVLVIVDVLLAGSPAGLHLTRSPGAQVVLGESTSTSLLVRNDGRRQVRALLRDAWQPSAGAGAARHTASLPPGESVRLTTGLTPVRRGDRLADRTTVRSYGPLRLAARQRSVAVPGTVRALPAFPSRRHLPSRLRALREIDGRAAVRVRGQGTEFDSLRDYVDGDDVRSLDWRATARRQHLVVRTWQPERDRRVVILLDTSRTSAGRVGDTTRLDHSMDAALLLAALASRAGDRVQFLAGDRMINSRVIGVHDRAQLLHRLVTAMTPLEPALIEADWSRLAGAVDGLSRQRALVVLLTSLEPAAIEEGLLPVLPALTARHRVVVASVTDPVLREMASQRRTAFETYDAAAAERTLTLRERAATALGQLGVTVLDESPDDLPTALVDHYLMLKRQSLL